MKTILSLGVVALSLAILHAADPQPVAPASESQPLPPPPAVDARPGGHRHPGADKMKRDGKPGWGHGDKMHGKREGMERGPKDKARAKVHPFAEALQLTDAQRAKARELMEAAKPRIEAIRQEERAKVQAVMEDSMKELRPMLTLEQRAVLDDLQKLRADRAALKPANPKAGAPAPGAPAPTAP